MFFISLAGHIIQVENRYPFVEKQCKDYLLPPSEAESHADFSVSVTEEEIATEQQNGDFSTGYCESICIYRKICEKFPAYGIFLMHSSVVTVNGLAYAFTAPSGTGKSTHTALWLKNLPGAKVLNGDKPLYRLNEDGSFTVFGTPWNGKENWGENASAPLAAVFFLTRSKENYTRKATDDEIIAKLIPQLYLRGSRESVAFQLKLMDALVRFGKYWILGCNISNEAALLAFQTVNKDNLENFV